MQVYLKKKTPDEYRAIAAKSHATRRANKAVAQALRADAIVRVAGLKDEIAELERQRDVLLKHQLANIESASLTGKALLSEKSIVEGASLYKNVSGVYFLMKDGCVVYVGQSVDIWGRISQHSREKCFDSIAYVPCAPRLLDKLEALYIYVLHPSLNGIMCNGANFAPLALDELLSS